MKQSHKTSSEGSPVLVDPHHLGAGELEDVLGIPSSTRKRWDSQGCPRAADKTYDAAAVHTWALERAERRGQRTDEGGELDRLKAERLRRNITMQDLVIVEKRRESMPVSEHRDILTSRAARWQALVTQIPREAYHFVGLPSLESARKALSELCVFFSDVWRLEPEDLRKEGYDVKENESGVTIGRKEKV